MGNIKNITEAISKGQLPALAKLRDLLISEGKATPVEASFIASVYAQLIDKDILTSKGVFNKVFKDARLNIPKEIKYEYYEENGSHYINRVIFYPTFEETAEKRTKLSDGMVRDIEDAENKYSDEGFYRYIQEEGSKLDEGGRWPDQDIPILQLLENPANLFKSNKLDKLTNDKLDLIKDIVEYWVLANPNFYIEYDIEIGSDGIVSIDEKQQDDKSLAIHSSRTREILEVIKKEQPEWYSHIVAVKNNRLILAFPYEDARNMRHLGAFYPIILRNEFEEMIKENFGLSRDTDPHEFENAFNRITSPFKASWCIASSTPANWINNYANSNTIIFYNFSLEPIKILADRIKIEGSDALLGEVHMINRSGSKDKNFWNWGNSPHAGYEVSRLNPPTNNEFYKNFDINSGTFTYSNVFGNFYADQANNLVEYSGDDKKTVEVLKVPTGIKSLKKDSIKGFTNLETLVLPSTLDTIETEAISECPNLKYIQVSDRFKIAEPGFIVLTNEQTYGNILLGVFSMKDGEVSVRQPRGIQFLDTGYAKAQGINVDNVSVNISNNKITDVLKVGKNAENVFDTNRINLYNKDGIRSYKTELIDVDKERYSKRLDLPRGIKNTSRVEGFTTRHLVVNNRKISDNDDPIRINFTPTRLTLNLDSLKPDQYDKVNIDTPSALTQFEVNANELNNISKDRLIYNFTALKKLYIQIDDTITEEGESYPQYIKYLVERNYALLDQLVTNNPKALYEDAKKYSEANGGADNKILTGEYKLFKGTGLRPSDIDGKVDLKSLEKGNVSIKESRNARLIFSNILKENINLSKPIKSYAQLTKSLSQIGLLNNDIMNNLVDQVDFIEDSIKEYRNYDFEVKYVMLPVVLNSDIKVKVVALLNNSGIILVTPMDVVSTYEELKDDHSKLSRINQTFSLYAEVVGFDSTDKELQDIIKRAYLTAGSYSGAFDAPEPAPEKEESADNAPDFGGEDFGFGDEDFGGEDFGGEDFGGEDFDLGEDFDTNLEAYKKFSLNTTSIKDLAHTLKTKTADIVKENIRIKKVENVLVIEVDNKNIYSLLEATPNLGRTILRSLGESIKNFPTTQLIDSFNKDGKRYFVVAECVNNNYWYTDKDEIKTLSLNENYVVPNKGNAIKVQKSSVRVDNRKVIPKLIGKKMVFTKGGK